MVEEQDQDINNNDVSGESQGKSQDGKFEIVVTKDRNTHHRVRVQPDQSFGETQLEQAAD